MKEKFVKKRNGQKVIFDQKKIKMAMLKAFFSLKEKINDNELGELSSLVLSKLGDKDIFEVEYIQDQV